ncbi:MAG: hypothetical protein OEQ29_15190 [Alphaproteobacteria bacterium]|nr:hypothetical protein [Alphaproteobacteria bacterium]
MDSLGKVWRNWKSRLVGGRPATVPTIWFSDTKVGDVLHVNWDKEPYWSYSWVDLVVEALSRRHPTVKEDDTTNAVGERIWKGTVGGIALKIDLDGSFGIEITTQIPEEVAALEVIEKSLRRELIDKPPGGAG